MFYTILLSSMYFMFELWFLAYGNVMSRAMGRL
uniref:Uncharacterized protein n=1 Tax=Arundo donax TaxID=35708 RepID=A0A0A9C3P2_ARUDO